MGSMVLPSQAYEVKLAPHPAPFSVFRFEGEEAVSRLYRYEIEFTSPVAEIPMDQVLGRPVKFIVDPIDPNADYLRKMFGENAEKISDKPPARTIHGIVTQFGELETSADETRYKLVIEPRIVDLARAVTSRLFQKQSVQEIITDTLRHYGFREGVDFKFNLRAKYKRHEYITQHDETTFALIQRICADEGVWFRFEQVKDREVIVFGDDLDAYLRNQRTVPFRRDAGLNSVGAEAIKSLRRQTQRVPEAVQVNDYNHRQADVSLLVEENVARDDKTTNAVDCRWGEHYETPEEGRRIARLRHEAHLAQQIIYVGKGNAFALEAGEVLRLDRNPKDAPHGLFITSVSSSGGRRETYSNTFTAIPSDRVWRTPVDPSAQPVISGILPARVTSPGDYTRAYLTPEGWYVIKLPFDLDEWSPGGTSRPVRLAKPYSGDNYGHHFPLIDGAEVAIAFTLGDPNRPVIIGAMHDSLHPDLVSNLNHTRNLIVTAAGNTMRMEDKEGSEHVHLMTPFQSSELNLGHMVDGDRKERGQGAELRSDEHVAVRGAKGVLVSAEAQPNATGQQLAMSDAGATFQKALDMMRSLNDSANAAKSWLAEIDLQRALIEQKLTNLQKPVIVANAPEGLGIASGQHVQLAARKQMFVTAGDGLDIGAFKRITAAAGEAISLFAAQFGIRIFAAKGKVQVQAQGDAMELMALKNVAVSSSTGEVIITGSKGITLGDGAGAYVKIANGKIEIASPTGEVIVKGNLDTQNAAGGSFTFPKWSDTSLKDVKGDMNFGFSE
ncbi:type VI secretion system Vgr family protein [Paraburkholderia phenazinium]|uniref:Type VI secretion system secreted protein VgrG n=1 Tax=Paraburkholderia phenazinium TaxID=60549 RepID=A0A1G7TZZ7_9BURK|nr:type VI secretion system Vgr family protein [Paraburkholderia phenazinium]SDG40738.1 type VI secretion system secreted protein VgrG [Paraburkholderia phenazinium]